MTIPIRLIRCVLLLLAVCRCAAEPEAALPGVVIDGSEAGWRELTVSDFDNVNGATNTWSWTNGVLHCTGDPTGVLASTQAYTNFEVVVEWRHLKSAGNSGLFVWGTASSLDRLRKGGKAGLPDGIEVQVLDLDYEANYEARHNKKPDWFTSHGDVFPVRAQMTPFPPVAPNGQRSFPSERRSKGVGQWNHYYVRCINGEVRLSVNGREVSGGNNCTPRTGHFCIESEGSPVEFRNLRLRELP